MASHENTVNLRLNKPKSWNWEICTDRSASHIKFPRVILCDKEGTLLADIHKANRVKSNRSCNTLNYAINRNKSQRLNDTEKRSSEYSYSVSIPEISIDKKSYCINNISHSSALTDETSIENIACNTDESEIPVYVYSGKGLILRNFKDKEFDEIRNQQKLNQVSQMRNTNFVAMTENNSSLSTDLNYIPSATLYPEASVKSNDDDDEIIDNSNDECSIHTIHSSENGENVAEYSHEGKTNKIKKILSKKMSQSLDLIDSMMFLNENEFEIVMLKRNETLGFIVKKHENHHRVEALVREPAISDGRIKPGDRIIAVNGVSLCLMTHEEVVKFLRESVGTVKLRLFRKEGVQQLGSGHSTVTNVRVAFQSKSLRPEAIRYLKEKKM